MSKTIAYYLDAIDNDSYMIDDETCVVCQTCGAIYDKPIFANFKMVKKKLDFSYTYDGYLIVSKRVRDFFVEKNYERVYFAETSEPNFFVFYCENVLIFDVVRRGTKFLDLCNSCNRYYEVIGATPVFLKNISNEIKVGVYRTDLFFGTGSNKSATIIVGIETCLELKAEKFKGCYFQAIKL